MLKKTVMTTILLGVACAVIAQTEPREDFGRDNLNNQYFLETDNLTRKGYVVYAWHQVNRSQADERNARFIREKIEFDCNFKKYRAMWTMSYTEHDGRGTLITSEAISNPEWRPAASDSITGRMLTFACVHVFRPR